MHTYIPQDLLVWSTAHDINNLLTVILGNTELVLSDQPGETPTREALEQIGAAARSAVGLTRRLLSPADTKRRQAHLLDLNALVHETTRLLRGTVTMALTVQLNLATHLPLLCADELQIQQVLLNLLFNAVEAIDQTDGCVIITTAVQEADHATSPWLDTAEPESRRSVVLAVSDTGRGMDPATVTRIFAPHFTTKQHGHGLGLTVVQQIVHNQGGTLHVQSMRGCGTTFTIWLPCAPVEATEAIHATIGTGD